MEGPYNQTTYTIGTSINGATTVACAAVYAGEPGNYSLNYSTIREFFASDYIQFFIQTSNIGIGGPFVNVVTLENGSANLVQIAN